MKALAAALVAAQQDMPAVAPDAVNPHFGNRFVSLDHLIASTKPVLTKHGLSIVQFPSELGGMPALTTVLLHTSGESTQGTTPLILAKQDMQGLGGSITYARRYAWASVLGISAEGDDDGNTASAGGQEGQAQRVTPNPPEPAPAQTKATFKPPPSATQGMSPITPPSEAQAKYLKQLLDKAGLEVGALGIPWKALTKQDASRFIEQLKDGSFVLKTPAELELEALGAEEFDESEGIPF